MFFKIIYFIHKFKILFMFNINLMSILKTITTGLSLILILLLLYFNEKNSNKKK
jgi:hypothetical protein